jgi:hypothetical protein
MTLANPRKTKSVPEYKRENLELKTEGTESVVVAYKDK